MILLQCRNPFLETLTISEDSTRALNLLGTLRVYRRFRYHPFGQQTLSESLLAKSGGHLFKYNWGTMLHWTSLCYQFCAWSQSTFGDVPGTVAVSPMLLDHHEVQYAVTNQNMPQTTNHHKPFSACYLQYQLESWLPVFLRVKGLHCFRSVLKLQKNHEQNLVAVLKRFSTRQISLLLFDTKPHALRFLDNAFQAFQSWSWDKPLSGWKSWTIQWKTFSARCLRRPDLLRFPISYYLVLTLCVFSAPATRTQELPATTRCWGFLPLLQVSYHVLARPTPCLCWNWRNNE